MQRGAAEGMGRRQSPGLGGRGALRAARGRRGPAPDVWYRSRKTVHRGNARSHRTDDRIVAVRLPHGLDLALCSQVLRGLQVPRPEWMCYVPYLISTWQGPSVPSSIMTSVSQMREDVAQS